MDGVDSAVSRVQDTKEVVVIEGAPPKDVSVRVTAVSQCGQRSDPASAITTVSAGKGQRRYDMRHKMLTQCTLFVLHVMEKRCTESAFHDTAPGVGEGILFCECYTNEK